MDEALFQILLGNVVVILAGEGQTWGSASKPVYVIFAYMVAWCLVIVIAAVILLGQAQRSANVCYLCICQRAVYSYC